MFLIRGQNSELLLTNTSCSLPHPLFPSGRAMQQKARMARIRIAKATSGAAFLSKKKETEARLLAAEQEQQNGGDDGEGGAGTGHASTSHGDDIFELQHHHLLQCLERTTVGQPTP